MFVPDQRQRSYYVLSHRVGSGKVDQGIDGAGQLDAGSMHKPTTMP